jgi:hypothetical protein
MDIADLERKLGIDGISAEQQMEIITALQQSAAEKIAKAKSESIGKGAELVIQGLKKIKSDMEQKFAQLNGEIQSKVASVQDGQDGKNGKDGRDGKQGPAGLTGPAGKDGVIGRDGVDGVDGISVQDAKIDFDGSLVITLSDGRELNVGEVVGSDIAEKIRVVNTMSTNSSITLKDEGTSVTSAVKSINFVGASVTATNSGDDVTVNVSSGTGTVTSVALSGGTTGLSVTGSPITTTGTITLAGTLAVANGGTNATTAADARTNLGLVIGTDVLSPSGSAASLTSFPTFNQNTTGTASNVTGTVAVLNGGTGATTTSGARTNLGLVIGTDVLAPTGSAASLTSFPTFNQNTTGTAASTPKLLTTNFTIEESGGKLIFKYGATTIASMSSTGLITSSANIVSNGTP